MNKFGFSLIVVLIITVSYVTYSSVKADSFLGGIVVGTFATLTIGLIFWTMQLISTWLHSTWEQKRFQDNAKENYANLLAQQKVQNEQTKGALMLADNAYKHQPKEEGSYLVFDENLFDGLED